jgi:hypothetical protein
VEAAQPSTQPSDAFSSTCVLVCVQTSVEPYHIIGICVIGRGLVSSLSAPTATASHNSPWRMCMQSLQHVLDLNVRRSPFCETRSWLERFSVHVARSSMMIVAHRCPQHALCTPCFPCVLPVCLSNPEALLIVFTFSLQRNAKIYDFTPVNSNF